VAEKVNNTPNTKDGLSLPNGLTPEHQNLLLKMSTWIQDAACKTTPDPGFIAERTNNAAKNHAMEKRPKEICRGCPVQFECLDHALKLPERGGIWGGKNDQERDAMAERLQRQYPGMDYKVLSR
jgi:WhiB family transcriptional regulator, redox-sensing transcriptional regulator